MQKRYKQRIIACSMASKKMVRLGHVRRSEKEIKPFLIDEK